MRLSEDEHAFLCEVKFKRGCSISAYLRFLIHRATYENLKVESRKHEKVMEKVTLLLHDKKLTKNFRLLINQPERDELERIKLKTGVSINTFCRWLVRRRMAEYRLLGGELFEIV